MSGLVFDSHQLVHNGEVLSGKSLAEYGVQKGSVLELVPYEPFVHEPMPEGSPLLSSPAHELVSRPYLADQSYSSFERNFVLCVFPPPEILAMTSSGFVLGMRVYHAHCVHHTCIGINLN